MLNLYSSLSIGNEYTAVVEFAPYQKIPKSKPKKTDSKKGTVEQGTSTRITFYTNYCNLIIVCVSDCHWPPILCYVGFISCINICSG